MKCINFTKNANTRVLVESKSLVSDSLGGSTNTWEEVNTYWAWVKPTTIFEKVAGDQLRGQAANKIVVRYTSDLADIKDVASYRIAIDSRLYNVHGVKNLDGTLKNYGKTYHEILAIENEVTANG